MLRTETRGSHWREDYPDTDDAHWRVRLVTRSTTTDGTMTQPRNRSSGTDAHDRPRRIADAIARHDSRARPAGLDPDDVEALVRRAVAEDLDGGVDVTTVATVPAGPARDARPRRRGDRA